MSSSQLAIVQTYKVQTNGNSTASKAKKPSHGSHSISVYCNTQQNIHGSVTECGRQHPVTDPYTLRYRPGKVHVAYRLYIRICAALIQHRYGTDLLHGSVTGVLSYCIQTVFTCLYGDVKYRYGTDILYTAVTDVLS